MNERGGGLRKFLGTALFAFALAVTMYIGMIVYDPQPGNTSGQKMDQKTPIQIFQEADYLAFLEIHYKGIGYGGKEITKIGGASGFFTIFKDTPVVISVWHIEMPGLPIKIIATLEASRPNCCPAPSIPMV